MLVNIKILADCRRLGKAGDERQLDSVYAEKYSKLGIIEIITDKKEKVDGNADERGDPTKTGLKDQEG